jgi:hypothetical protein
VATALNMFGLVWELLAHRKLTRITDINID